ncbi:lipoyl(octanoyl) transferase LipB [Pseudanabaena sp. FACHB-2040]|uniref:lipoyl(octanoyl) transferase LipB n=1 Tax=Pseudanabaena sp. FACHB-2040 TaxID=2692859 RepID=UPI001683484F|nr:lipoyl(octanoyl) transferase LipB [Pseudanabaena sp. FACHB-2040]MBD2259070.1 lipoyl(octanoyl) transferase LipB [Pseudanabaena sp. FACHB-2040]
MVRREICDVQRPIPGDRICTLYNLGLVPYETAWRWQQSLVQHKKAGLSSDVLMLLEHPPVYTLGQGADPSLIKFDPDQEGHSLYRIERGGEVTYHCPGQLVGYPVLDLKRFQLDLHWYLRQLEEVVIQTLSQWGLVGTRVAGLTGVWIDGYKVAAIGIKVSRWITMHGFALNVCSDLAGFQRIVPCGIVDKPVGSLHQFCPGIDVEQVRPVVATAFAQVFGVSLQEPMVDLATLLR